MTPLLVAPIYKLVPAMLWKNLDRDSENVSGDIQKYKLLIAVHGIDQLFQKYLCRTQAAGSRRLHNEELHNMYTSQGG
jgi:hypothetical protein